MDETTTKTETGMPAGETNHICGECRYMSECALSSARLYTAPVCAKFRQKRGRPATLVKATMGKPTIPEYRTVTEALAPIEPETPKSDARLETEKILDSADVPADGIPAWAKSIKDSMPAEKPPMPIVERALASESENWRKTDIPAIDKTLYWTPSFKEMGKSVEKYILTRTDFIISGPAGSGKTKLIEQMCARMGRAVITVNCTGDMRSGSLLGRIAPDPETGKMHWEKGLVEIAAERGEILLLDEINMLDPEIQSSIHGLLTTRKMTLANNSRTFYAHPDFLIAGTMNPGYLGTKPLTEAFENRFIQENQTYDIAIDKKIVANMPEPEVIQDALISLVKQIRASVNNKEMRKPFGHRTLAQVVSLRKMDFDLMGSLDRAYLNKLSTQDQQVIKTFIADLNRITSTYTPEVKKEVI